MALALMVPRWLEAPAHVALLLAVVAGGGGAILPTSRVRLLLLAVATVLYAVTAFAAIFSVGLLLLPAAGLAGYAAVEAANWQPRGASLDQRLGGRRG